ncbi:tubulin beta chain [Tanacetum coccineum]|uniref:Tubulin beta chain n=1 Tax=Tanacetum coccineum TaxID=301880 RepID=A0ABQ5JBT9_9ASTR
MRKRFAQKDLEVHQNCNAVVEIVFCAESSSFHGTLLILKTEEEYTDRMMMTFSVFSPTKVFVTVAEHYNATRVDCGCVAVLEAVACLDDVWNLDNLLVVDPIDPATIMTQE